MELKLLEKAHQMSLEMVWLNSAFCFNLIAVDGCIIDVENYSKQLVLHIWV